MPAPTPISKRRLLLVLALLLATGGGWYFWTWYRTPPPIRVTKPAAAFVRVSGQGQGSADPLLQEQAELLDPTPLFIPTERNFGQGGLPARIVPQPGQVFGSYPAKPHFADNGLPGYGDNRESTPDSLPEVISRGNEAPFAGFGQIDPAREALPERALMIEVKSVATGSIVLAQAVSKLKRPAGDFAPVEFLATVGPTGLVGEPVLTSGSGSEDFDGLLRDFIGKDFRLGERVQPGRYLIVLGP